MKSGQLQSTYTPSLSADLTNKLYVDENFSGNYVTVTKNTDYEWTTASTWYIVPGMTTAAVSSDGTYFVSCTINVSQTTTNDAFRFRFTDGTTPFGAPRLEVTAPAANHIHSYTLTGTLDLGSGDTVGLQVYGVGTGSKKIRGDANRVNTLTAIRIGS